MQPASWYYHRLRSMDAGEILWRVRSMLSAQLDIIRMPLKVYPRLNGRHKVWSESARANLGFSVLPDDLDWEKDAEPFQSWSGRLMDQADQILEDRLSFFDLQDQFIGDPIDWHMDWSAKKSAPLRLSVLTDYRDFRSVGDCKLVWEPNRHHQLVVLGRAYKVSGDKKYAKKVVQLLLNWINANPVGYGMNWKSPLEIGIRLINWVWAIDLIRDADVIDDSSWAAIVDSIYVAEWDVQRKFSEGSSANNHLIGEAAGVFIATSYLPQLPNAHKWNAESRKILEREIVRQSYADGCSREHAFGYQFFVLQFLTLSGLIAEKVKKPLSKAYFSRLHEMYKFIANVSADSGVQPNLGDADDGYVLDLGELPKQAPQLISVGGHMMGDARLIGDVASESAFWLFGKTSFANEPEHRPLASSAFPESGYYLLRSDTDDGSTKPVISVLFDCAELGYDSIAAHGHADCLSFTLNVGNVEFLVDPGTYDYFSYPEWRQSFRETRAHNTVEVDDESQSISLGPFLWGDRANAEALHWRDEPQRVEICGRHDGYTRLADPLVHTRRLCLDKSERELLIDDSFDCKSQHTIRRYFHLSEHCSVNQVDEQTVLISRSTIKLSLVSESGKIEIVSATDTQQLGWVSTGYHVRRPSNCIVITNEIRGSDSLETVIKVV